MKIEIARHSLSHILALAIKRIYGDVLFGIGPAVDNGFYYDFDFGKKKIEEKELAKIEKEMKKIIKENLPFKKELISKRKAHFLFINQPYKLEILKEIPGKKVTIYKLGEFTDLCEGPHIKYTGEIPIDSFKLERIAGAYWKGDEKNPMLTRIYGLAFKNKEELDKYISMRKEAEKRDHRILGQKLELFLFDELVGAGLPLWQPKGALLRKIIENFLTNELLKSGYQLVRTPHIGKEDLFKKSGHLDFYKEDMYSPIEIDKEKYYLKPMNCPFHIEIYKSKIRSWREMPLRFAEFGTVYRYERSGVLHGLTRVRGFTQDDAHIWCLPSQIEEELEKLLKFSLRILKTFGFKKYNVYLSTRPEKYIGSLKIWKKSENALRYALKQNKISYQEDKGGGVFYGPKIDIKIKDSLGREWQCTTIQIDFNLPERFDVYYIDKKGQKKRPVMIHRALLGSLERFIGVLLEHYGGALPFWLSPEQIWVIPLGKRHVRYAKEIAKQLTRDKFRVKIRDEKATVSKKIREGEIQKIPYLLVVGDKETKEKTVRIRKRGKGDLGVINLMSLIEKIKIEAERKK